MSRSPISSRCLILQMPALCLLMLAASAPTLAFEPALGQGRIIKAAAVSNQQAAAGIKEALAQGTL
ncbi:MAG: hypothetical protein ACREQN_04145, partial [Candidatus Binataceae bacterium]